MTISASNLTPYALTKSFPVSPLGDGEWQAEPHVLTWKENDFPCAIIRAYTGGLAGYVGLPASHPSVNFVSMQLDFFQVHGEITYNEWGKDRVYYWIGFDCSHHSDFKPAIHMLSSNSENAQYRNISYVKEQITSLIQQIQTIPPAGQKPSLLSAEGKELLRAIFVAHVPNGRERFDYFCQTCLGE